MITFTEYVAECLRHCQDGLIMESELLAKIETASRGQMLGVASPTSDYEALGINPPTELPPIQSAMTTPEGWDKTDTSTDETLNYQSAGAKRIRD